MIYGLPKLSIDPVLFLPLWLGTLRDYSGNGNHGEPKNSIHWRTHNDIDGTMPGDDTGHIGVTYSASLAVTNFTFFIVSRSGFIQAVNQQLWINRTGVSYQFNLQPDRMRLRCGSANSDLVIDYTGATSAAATLISGGAVGYYLDGAYVGAGDSAIVPGVSSVDLDIAGAVSSSAITECQLALIYPGVLSASEIEALHAYSQSLVTPRKQWPGSGLRLSGRRKNEMTDPNSAASYTGFNNPAITDTDGPKNDGAIKVAYIDTANPVARQNNVFDLVRKYYIDLLPLE